MKKEQLCWPSFFHMRICYSNVKLFSPIITPSEKR